MNFQNTSFLFLISFAFYMFGQILWLLSIYLDDPIFNDTKLEIIAISVPFSFFAIFGLIASLKLYLENRDK